MSEMLRIKEVVGWLLPSGEEVVRFRSDIVKT